MTSDVYLLDANVFIEAHRRYYGLDLCPGFWECLTHYSTQARLCSIDQVRDEIRDGDALAEWAKGVPEEMFVSSAEPAAVTKYAEIVTWVNDSDFTDAAKSKFASEADGWLAAYAQVHSMVLVTHETYERDRKNKVKLPNVCRKFGVQYLDIFSMLRSFEVRFDWTPS